MTEGDEKLANSRWIEVFRFVLASVVNTLQFLVGLVMPVVLMALLLGFMMCGVLAHIDALWEQRLPLVSWPVLLLFWAFILLTFKVNLDERRKRRELPEKLAREEFPCPLCKEPLTGFHGFEVCEHEPLHITGTHWPEGSFRLHCESCQRDVWFSAYLDGTHHPHVGWWFSEIDRSHLDDEDQPRGCGRVS